MLIKLNIPTTKKYNPKATLNILGQIKISKPKIIERIAAIVKLMAIILFSSNNLRTLNLIKPCKNPYYLKRICKDLNLGPRT